MHIPLKEWVFWWFVLSAVLWWPVARGWHATGFRWSWLLLSVLWWSPVALGYMRMPK